MRNWLLIISLLFGLGTNAQRLGKNDVLLEVVFDGDSLGRYLLVDSTVYRDGWYKLAQPVFWQKAMCLHPDSCLINIAETRTILDVHNFKEWKAQTEPEKDVFKDSIRTHYNLDSATKIYITSGKSEFYKFKRVLPSVSRGIEIFAENKTDPFYAQAILLIESPNKLQYSPVKAYGPFQLMKKVAINLGLTVNRYHDDRKDFDKSGWAAAKLIREICIPEAERILTNHNIKYDKSDLWFRLFVLHIYHAGAGNVEGLLNSMSPSSGGMELITSMWQNEWGGFKNASQNYSQVALASTITVYEMVGKNGECRYECNEWYATEMKREHVSSDEQPEPKSQP